jgi:hypothetical protein
VRKELRCWLRELHDELHVTSLFVTHDQEEALEVADRVVLMNAGKVEQIGTPAEVYDQPASAFVHSFLGSVNLFRGRVAGQGLGIGEQQLVAHQLPSGRECGHRLCAPHELEILPGCPGWHRATITRLLPMGPRIRVELRGNGDTNGAHFEAELSKEAARAFAPGQGVRLVAKQAQLYPITRFEGRPRAVQALTMAGLPAGQHDPSSGSGGQTRGRRRGGPDRPLSAGGDEVNFQQLRIIREAARRDYNLTDVANALFTSQSGVSRHIRELEEELGLELFIRYGKRLLGMTEPGKELLVIAERILGMPTTSANWRAPLPIATRAGCSSRPPYPGPLCPAAGSEGVSGAVSLVQLELRQGSPEEIVRLVQTGEVDIGISSEQLDKSEGVVAFPTTAGTTSSCRSSTPHRRAGADPGRSGPLAHRHLSGRPHRSGTGG